MKAVKFLSIFFILSFVLVVGNKAYAAKSCSINSPTISFGTSFNPINNTQLQTTFSGVITVTCSGMASNSNISISFAVGARGTTIFNRFLQSSTPNTLNFNIYKTDATTVLGSTSGTNTLNAVCNSGNCTRTFDIIGIIPAQTTAKADVNQYIDTITMTLTY